MESVQEKVSIRTLRAEDADEIRVIYGLITNKEVNSGFNRMVVERAHEAGHEAHFVAELDGKVVGFMISYILPFGFGAEECAYIATMGVHPKVMGQGIGAGMIKEVFKFYRSKKVVRVYASIRWDSTDLLSFCKTVGFERSEYINLQKELE